MLSKALFKPQIGRRMFSYKALIKNYDERHNIEDRMKRLNEDKFTYHTRYRTRIGHFMRTKKKRFLYFFIGFMIYQLIDNILKLTGSRMERNFKLLKKRIMTHYYPEILHEPTSLKVNENTKLLSTKTERELGDRFVELDNIIIDIIKGDKRTENGITRQLLLDLVKNIGKYDEKIEKDFLALSPYRDPQER